MMRTVYPPRRRRREARRGRGARCPSPNPSALAPPRRRRRFAGVVARPSHSRSSRARRRPSCSLSRRFLAFAMLRALRTRAGRRGDARRRRARRIPRLTSEARNGKSDRRGRSFYESENQGKLSRSEASRRRRRASPPRAVARAAVRSKLSARPSRLARARACARASTETTTGKVNVVAFGTFVSDEADKVHR